MVVIVVFLPPIAAFNQHAVGISIHNFLHDAGILIITVLKAVAFIALMLIYGRRLIPKILHAIERTGSHELFRLAVFVIALVVAFMAAKLFGVSFALGAFFAGMILNESALSHRAAEETLPLRDAFAVLFFVAMGMLFQPTSLFSQPLLILMTTIIIIFGKSLATFLIVILFRYPVYTALMISASLAQIGEFSFILAEMGTRLGLLTQQAKDLIIAASLISIILNPLWFRALMKIKKH
jgi:CPA2 family monovalent cation:H+ antiporter-2